MHGAPCLTLPQLLYAMYQKTRVANGGATIHATFAVGTSRDEVVDAAPCRQVGMSGPLAFDGAGRMKEQTTLDVCRVRNDELMNYSGASRQENAVLRKRAVAPPGLIATRKCVGGIETFFTSGRSPDELRNAKCEDSTRENGQASSVGWAGHRASWRYGPDAHLCRRSARRPQRRPGRNEAASTGE